MRQIPTRTFSFSNSAVVSMHESYKLDPVSTCFGLVQSVHLETRRSFEEKMHCVLMLTKIKFTSMQKGRKFKFLSSCCVLVILVDFLHDYVN